MGHPGDNRLITPGLGYPPEHPRVVLGPRRAKEAAARAVIAAAKAEADRAEVIASARHLVNSVDHPGLTGDDLVAAKVEAARLAVSEADFPGLTGDALVAAKLDSARLVVSKADAFPEDPVEAPAE